MNILRDENQMWMRYAINEANKALESDEVPIGAVVVKDNKIIGKGYNQCEKLFDPTAHAEIIAISSAANTLKDWRLTNCSLYVTKEPCSMCSGALVNARLKYICFGAYDEKEGCCGSLYQICRDPRFKHQLEVKGGVYKEECAYLIQDFFKRIRS